MLAFVMSETEGAAKARVCCVYLRKGMAASVPGTGQDWWSRRLGNKGDQAGRDLFPASFITLMLF